MMYFASFTVLATLLFYADVLCSLRNQAGLDSE